MTTTGPFKTPKGETTYCDDHKAIHLESEVLRDLLTLIQDEIGDIVYGTAGEPPTVGEDEVDIVFHNGRYITVLDPGSDTPHGTKRVFSFGASLYY